ncbi:MAG: alpha/beta hydrolase [Microscillaceae bacterium]|jgi:phospholipase/carboxylesterase|nr:alpha/beta hydrolase [Microscillaceae bacterium]
MHSYQILEKGKPLAQAQKVLILLHGRGGSAQDIIGLADEFCDDTFYIAAPQATNHTWYPYSFMAARAQNEPWLSSAITTVKKLLDEVSQQILTENIYLMGFSQGACLTLEVATRFAQKYAGVVAFTGGLIGDSLWVENYQGDFAHTKVFIGNGDRDPHVPLLRSQESAQIMTDLGAEVKLKVYPNMPHSINQDELNTVREWMF